MQIVTVKILTSFEMDVGLFFSSRVLLLSLFIVTIRWMGGGSVGVRGGGDFGLGLYHFIMSGLPLNMDPCTA